MLYFQAITVTLQIPFHACLSQETKYEFFITGSGTQHAN